MNRTEIFLAILEGAAIYVPGGTSVQAGIKALVHRNIDPNDDADEIADAITKIAVGTIQVVEGLKAADYVNDEVFKLVVDNIRADIKLLRLVLVKKVAPASITSADPVGVKA